MSPRPVTAGAPPQPPAALLAWGLVIAAAVVTSASTAVWAGGQIATRLATGHPARTSWSPLLVVDTITDPAGTWPAAAPAGVWAWSAIIFLPLFTLVVGVGVRAWWRRPDADAPQRSLAATRDVRGLTEEARRRQALRLRPRTLVGASPKSVSTGDAGVVVGRLDRGRGEGPLLLAGWEDVLVAIMAPRQGKTTSLVIPTIVSAPGAVVATSNKSDVLISQPVRRQLTGQPTYVFDPQGVAATRQRVWWNPLRGVATVEAAERLAGHFLSAVKSSREPMWHTSATELLGGLILAAAADGRDMAEVYRWLVHEHATEPPDILDRAGFPTVAASLEGFPRLPDETRGSVYFTARAATACLRNPEIMAWVTPQPGMRELIPSQLVGTRQTVYLQSKDSEGSAAPLIGALADAAIQAGMTAGMAAGGRIDPPLTVVLDEAANVARIKDLPELVSHAGSRGVVITTVLQSFPQGERVWQPAGMKALWSAATIKLIGPGQDDSAFNDNVSKLLGEHWVATTGHSISSGGRGGGTSSSTSLSKQRVMSPGALRALPTGSAVLLAAGHKPCLVQLQPWYRGGHAEALRRSEEALHRHIAARAGLP